MARHTPYDDETLAAHVRGDCEPALSDAIESEAATSPDLAARLAAIRGIHGVLSADANASAPGALGWARLSRDLDRTGAGKGTRRAFPSRLRGWGRLAPFQMAAAAALSVVAWQGLVVPLLAPPGEAPDGYVTASERPAGQGADSVASVIFRPDARAGDIEPLLRESGARILDGPSALGLYRIGFADPGSRATGVETLREAEKIVEFVQPE